MGNSRSRAVLATLNRTLLLALPFILIALGVAALFIVFKATAGQEQDQIRVRAPTAARVLTE